MGHPSRSGWFCALPLSIAVSVLGVSPAVRAEPMDSEATAVESARSTFYRALALQDQGRWAEALELFEKVAETRESAQVRFNIAFDQEHLGRLATAARGYERAILLAEQSGAKNVISAANDRLTRLSSRIARLVLRPVGEGIAVTVDGVELASSDWGRAVPFEIGEHAIHAQADGRLSYRASVTLGHGETRELVIELASLQAGQPRSVPSLPLLTLEPGRNQAPPVPRQAPKPNALPYVAAGAALLSLATASVFYALRKDALDTMRSGCHEGRCPEELHSTDELGSLYTTVANVALATGIGLGGVSAGLFISQLEDDGDDTPGVGVRASVSTTF